jgi:hypothetical protein
MNILTLGSSSSAGSFNYLQNGSKSFVNRSLYNVDINNDGLDEVVFTGFSTNKSTWAPTNVAIFGWTNGKFVDQTSQWLPNKINQVEGVGDVAVGDFNGDGKKDLFLSAYTDSDKSATAYQMLNKGGQFERVGLGVTVGWQHGTACGDINKDGFDDVYATGYQSSPAMYMGSKNGLVKYTFKGFANGSDVAFGDFLSDGTLQAIITDPNGVNSRPTLSRMIVNDVDRTVSLNVISTLPSGTQPHAVRAVTTDFNNDGLSDVVILGRAWFTGGVWPEISSFQFLKNIGRGQFQDVTSTMLPNYNTNTNITYNPVFADFNADGKIDILSSQSSWASKNISTTMLVQQSDGTFLDTWRSVLSDGLRPGNVSTVIRGPDGYYLVTEHQNMGVASVKYSLLLLNGKSTQTISKPTIVNETHSLSIIVDKGVLGTFPVLVKDLVEHKTLTDGVITNHTIVSGSTTYNYNDIDKLIMTVTRDGEFTSEFRTEIIDQYPLKTNVTYKDAVTLVGIANIDNVIVAIAGADGAFVN